MAGRDLVSTWSQLVLDHCSDHMQSAPLSCENAMEAMVLFLSMLESSLGVHAASASMQKVCYEAMAVWYFCPVPHAVDDVSFQRSDSELTASHRGYLCRCCSLRICRPHF
jgi:hypothetical protein